MVDSRALAKQNRTPLKLEVCPSLESSAPTVTPVQYCSPWHCNGRSGRYQVTYKLESWCAQREAWKEMVPLTRQDCVAVGLPLMQLTLWFVFPPCRISRAVQAVYKSGASWTQESHSDKRHQVWGHPQRVRRGHLWSYREKFKHFWQKLMGVQYLRPSPSLLSWLVVNMSWWSDSLKREISNCPESWSWDAVGIIWEVVKSKVKVLRHHQNLELFFLKLVSTLQRVQVDLYHFRKVAVGWNVTRTSSQKGTGLRLCAFHALLVLASSVEWVVLPDASRLHNRRALRPPQCSLTCWFPAEE